jgi:tripartite motif-containing protein 71
MNKKEPDQSVSISRRQFLKGSLAIGAVSALSFSFPKLSFSAPQDGFKRLFSIDGFIDPYGIAVNNDGLVYVTDAGGYSVKVFDQAGKLIQTIGKAGSSGDSLNYPQGISFDTNGDLYVIDSNNGRIAIFSSDGKLKNSIGEVGGYPEAFYTPKGIFVSDKIYACNTRTHQLIGSYGDLGDDPKDLPRGTLAYHFRLPTDVVVADGGEIYIVDSKHGQIKALAQNGEFLFSFGENGSGEGQFNLPEGITLDRQNNIYVCDAMNGRIQKFDSQGNFLGALNEGLKRPVSICMDNEDKFYVVDAEQKQAIKFEWTA